LILQIERLFANKIIDLQNKLSDVEHNYKILCDIIAKNATGKKKDTLIKNRIKKNINCNYRYGNEEIFLSKIIKVYTKYLEDEYVYIEKTL